LGFASAGVGACELPVSPAARSVAAGRPICALCRRVGANRLPHRLPGGCVPGGASRHFLAACHAGDYHVQERLWQRLTCHFAHSGQAASGSAWSSDATDVPAVARKPFLSTPLPAASRASLRAQGLGATAGASASLS
jgi:hypothetical protein